jgi:hypothetical protein
MTDEEVEKVQSVVDGMVEAARARNATSEDLMQASVFLYAVTAEWVGIPKDYSASMFAKHLGALYERQAQLRAAQQQ